MSRGLAALAERAGFDLRVYRDTAELFTAWVPVVPSYSGSVAGCWDWLADRLAHDGRGSAQ